ncbi:MAG: hypothetical protein E6J89_19810, partial [Deltaproteobacteria bacterium]
MAKGTVGNLLVTMRAELGQLSTDVKEIEKTFQGGFAKIKADAADMGRAVASALGVGLSVGALVGFGKQLIAIGDQLSDISDKTGLSIAVLGGLRTVIDQTGGSLEGFATTILKAQKNLGAVGTEGEGAQIALNRLHLRVEDLKNLRPEEFLQRFANALATVTDRNDRVNISAAIFGKAAGDLIPVLDRIAKDGLRPLSEETELAYKNLGILADKAVAAKNAVQDFFAGLLTSGVRDPLGNLNKQIADLELRIEKMSRARLPETGKPLVTPELAGMQAQLEQLKNNREELEIAKMATEEFATTTGTKAVVAIDSFVAALK